MSSDNLAGVRILRFFNFQEERFLCSKLISEQKLVTNPPEKLDPEAG